MKEQRNRRRKAYQQSTESEDRAAVDSGASYGADPLEVGRRRAGDVALQREAITSRVDNVIGQLGAVLLLVPR